MTSCHQPDYRMYNMQSRRPFQLNPILVAIYFSQLVDTLKTNGVLTIGFAICSMHRPHWADLGGITDVAKISLIIDIST